MRPEAAEWVVGSQEVAYGTERVRIDPPERIRLRRPGPQGTLKGLLESGGIDAVVTPRPPSSLQRGDGRVVRLLPDRRSAETDYCRRTGLVPIMHCVAIRRGIAEAHPWLPAEVVRAFSAASGIATGEFQRSGVLPASLPWIAAHHEETQALKGATSGPTASDPTATRSPR